MQTHGPRNGFQDGNTCDHKQEQEPNQKKKKTMRDPPTLPKYSSGLAGVGGGTGELKV